MIAVEMPQEVAVALSDWLRPSLWRVFAYRRWRKHQQPDHIAAAVWAAIRGEYEPLRIFGAQS